MQHNFEYFNICLFMLNMETRTYWVPIDQPNEYFNKKRPSTNLNIRKDWLFIMLNDVFIQNQIW